ncbi:MAG: photosynthetic complex putative assembly protein PuhB [Pseudomonadota bacterium]
MEEEDDFRFEPVRGLPAPLPPGERILWQGAPAWWSLAKRAFFVRIVVAWFALMVAWHLLRLAMGGLDAGAFAALATWQLVLCGISVGILAGIACLYARTTVYTITNKRIVLRSGLALDLTINLPFSQITNVDFARRGDGSGDLAIALNGNGRISYLHLWPHARPLHFAAPQPMLRALEDPSAVAGILGEALREARATAPATAPVVAPVPAAQPVAAQPVAARKEVPSPRQKATLQRGDAIIPGWAAALGAFVMLGSLAATTWVVVTQERPTVTLTEAAVVETRDLAFRAESERLEVLDAADGSVVATLATEEGGFIRSVLKAMDHARSESRVGPELPYRLTSHADGRLAITDLATGRMIDINAFGSAQVAAFAALL